LYLEIVRFLRRATPKKYRKPIVLGKQLADAKEKERQRKSVLGDVPSPLPKAKYSVQEKWLLNPVENQLDRDLKRAYNQFSHLTQSQRDIFRKSISLDEFYILLTFSQRCAVFAIREKDHFVLRAGFGAIAMIEMERTDFRDVSGPVGLLYYAANRIGFDPASEISEAAKLSEPNVQKLLLDFLKWQGGSKFTLKSWLYKEVETSEGLGIVNLSIHKYNPQSDLLKIILDISKLIEADEYITVSLDLGERIPEVWFGNQKEMAKKELHQANGTICVHARLNEKYGENAWKQSLFLWLAEMKKDKSPAYLMELIRSKHIEGRYLLAVGIDKLFCLVVAGSWVEKVESFEKEDSLLRFENGIKEALIEGQHKY